MSKLEKLDLMGVASLAVVVAAVLAAWMVATSGLESPARSAAREGAVTLTEDGRMKLVVTAEADTPAAASTRRVAAARPTGGPSLEVALPFVFRP